MQIKIGSKLYDSREIPILLILSDEEKEEIAGMDTLTSSYCKYPEGADVDKITKWMNEPALDG